MTLVAATNLAMGSPARFAISPAVRLPKLPDGVHTTTADFSSRPSRARDQTGDRVEVVHHLRKQTPDVDRVCRCQADSLADLPVAERLARQPMAVVEAARDGVRADVPDVPDVPIIGGVEHRQLRFLRRADASLRVEDDDARMRHAVERMGNRAARIARRGRQHGERLIAGVERRHEPRHRPRADVLECQRGTVEQLQGVDAGLDLDDRDGEIQRLDDGCLESGRVELRRACRAAARGRRSRSTSASGAARSRAPAIRRSSQERRARRPAPAPRRAPRAERPRPTKPACLRSAQPLTELRYGHVREVRRARRACEGAARGTGAPVPRRCSGRPERKSKGASDRAGVWGGAPHNHDAHVESTRAPAEAIGET